MEISPLGKRNGTTERAVASPGAAQKSILMDTNVGVEEEEVFRQIQVHDSTINTSHTDIVKSKNMNNSVILAVSF